MENTAAVCEWVRERVRIYRNVSEAAPGSHSWTRWKRAKHMMRGRIRGCETTCVCVTSRKKEGKEDLEPTWRNSPWTCWGSPRPAATAADGTPTCSDTWSRSVDERKNTWKVTAKQNTKRTSKTKRMKTRQFPLPRPCIVSDTSGSTTSTSGAPWTWCGWRSPSGTGSRLSPSWENSVSSREPGCCFQTSD